MVGRNGTGKSTLFKVIRGELAAEHGSVTLPPRWRVGSLAQEAPNGPESLITVVLKADLEREALLTEAESATDPHRIAEIQTRLVDIDAHSAPSRAAAIIAFEVSPPNPCTNGAPSLGWLSSTSASPIARRSDISYLVATATATPAISPPAAR